MVKYRVNLMFKENGKSLNETITDILKIELEKMIHMTCHNFKRELPIRDICYSQNGGSSN